MSRRANTARTDWKVYKAPEKTGRLGEFAAAFKEPADAAVMIAFYGDGAQIRYKHHTLVWTEGKEDQPAGENYDHVAGVCIDRVTTIRREAIAQAEAQNARVIAARRARGEKV